MTFVVPFDASPLSTAALVRAVAFSRVLEVDVVALTVVPRDNARYAREKGWLASSEPFDLDAVVDTLREEVTAVRPDVAFEYELVGQYATRGTIAGRIRRRATDLDASMVFVGSDNAGRLVSSLSTVGGTVAADDSYDVVIIRHVRPSTVEKLRELPEADDLEAALEGEE